MAYSRFDHRSTLDQLRTFLARRFRVDTRSLAALRIGLGCLLLVDLARRAGSIGLFYTDDGVYPVSAFEATYGEYAGYSLHALSGALWFQQLLFVLAGCFALAFLVGYRTRQAGVLSLVLLLSLQARNPAVLNGGDRLLRVLLLVALVTPLGERWSIDALRRAAAANVGSKAAAGARATVGSFGTAALLLQPIVVFTANAIEKRRGETWYRGEGLELALANDAVTIYLGNVIVEFPAVLTVLNYGWVGLLAGSALFLLLAPPQVRTLAVFAYLCAFLGMASALAVGLFPFVLAASVLPFLPGLFWNALERRMPSRWIERWPSPASFEPLRRPPLERRPGSTLRARNHDTLVASLRISSRYGISAIGMLVLVWMLLFGASTVSGHDVPEAVDYPHLDQQRWGLYAPDPGDSYSWYVTAATLSNGSTAAIDGGEVGFDRPPDVAATYETFRHRRLVETVDSATRETPEPGALAVGYAEWACETAAVEYGTDIDRVTVYRLDLPRAPADRYSDDATVDPSRQTLLEYDCTRT